MARTSGCRHRRRASHSQDLPVFTIAMVVFVVMLSSDHHRPAPTTVLVLSSGPRWGQDRMISDFLEELAAQPPGPCSGAGSGAVRAPHRDPGRGGAGRGPSLLPAPGSPCGRRPQCRMTDTRPARPRITPAIRRPGTCSHSTTASPSVPVPRAVRGTASSACHPSPIQENAHRLATPQPHAGYCDRNIE